MDLPSLDTEELTNALLETRPLKAARLALGPEGLAKLLPDSLLAGLNNLDSQHVNDVVVDPLAQKADMLSKIILEAAQQSQVSKSAAAQMGFGTVPVADITSPKDQAEVNIFKPKPGPEKGTAPEPPGTQIGTKVAYIDEASIAALGYAPDMMALSSGNVDRDDRFLNPNQVLSLGGAASAAYLLNNLRSSSQAKKLIKSPVDRYLKGIQEGGLTNSDLKLLNKELKLLGVSGTLRSAENIHIANAAVNNLTNNLASSITRNRIKAVAPVAATAALASLIYNNLAPRSNINGPANPY
jgi:hypothetical protein